MYCDKREHLVGKIILDNFKILKKVEENWLVKIYTCIDLISNQEYIIQLVRIFFINEIRKGDL
jgi:hypothetical protein